MRKQLTICGLIAVLCLSAGCGKSDNPGGQSSSNSGAPNSGSSQDPNAPQGSSTGPNGGTSAAAQALAPNGSSGGGPGAGGVQAPAQTPAPPPPPPPQPIVVPAGKAIPVILSQALSSRTNSSGDEFEGSVASAVSVDGQEAIPKGSKVTGTVVNAKKQGSVKGEATLSIKLSRITVRGKSYLIGTSAYSQTVKGKGKRSAVMTGGGAAVGALIGGLAGVGKGAAIGAGVGGGGGLAASAGTGGENVNLAAESRVTFRLSDSVTLDPPTN